MKNFLQVFCCCLFGITAVQAASGRYGDSVRVNKAPSLSRIQDVALCPSRDQQTIILRGISAGEEWQRTALSVVTDNNNLFDYVEVHPLSNGNGYLKFKAATGKYGTANVTVTVKDDGGKENGGIDEFSRNFQVTIYAPPVVKTIADVVDESIKTSTKTSTGSRFQLLATASSSRTEFYWSPAEGLNNADIADPIYTARDLTPRTYSVTATNEYGCKTVESVKISPAEISHNLSLTASPNPVTNRTTVKFMVKGRDQAVSLNAYGAAGYRVANIYTGDAKAGQVYTVSLDGSRFTSGIYYLRLATAAESKSLKLIIAR